MPPLLQAPYKALRGHSRIVTAMAFSFDNAWLVSVGGEDSAAFKWRVSAEPEVAVDASSKTVWCVAVAVAVAVGVVVVMCACLCLGCLGPWGACGTVEPF